MTAIPPYFTDAEVDAMCAGLVQDAAKVRYLRSLGLQVHRKPNGKPLAWRPQSGPAATSEDRRPGEGTVSIAGLQQWAASRKGRNSGAKAQGR